MVHNEARDATFGDDYIPLMNFEQDRTYRRSISTPNQPRPRQRAARLEHLFNGKLGQHGNDDNEDSNVIVVSSSEMDVQMRDWDSGERSILDSTVLSSPNHCVQTAVLDDRRPLAITSPNTSAQLMGEGFNPSLSFTSTSTQDTHAKRVICCVSVQSHIEPTASSYGPDQACPHILSATEVSKPETVSEPQVQKNLQQRRLAESDLTQIDKLQRISNAMPRMLQAPSPTNDSPNSSWLKSMVLTEYTENLKGLNFSEFLALDDEGLRARGVNPYKIRGQMSRVNDQFEDSSESYNNREASDRVITEGTSRCLNDQLKESHPQPLTIRLRDVSRANDYDTHSQAPHKENIRASNEAQRALLTPKLQSSGLDRPWHPEAMRDLSSGNAMHHLDPFRSNAIFQRSTTSGEPGTYLPFKLQHDLLNAIQTLIEEACFYFTQKWLPGVLNGKGWDTPEQGELTAWWDMLKDCYIPPHATEFRGDGVAIVFRNCRHIRNNAVHRSRVAIVGIKWMMRDAMQLLCGLKDAPREAKMRKFQDYLERRDLEALRRSIDEPLESFRLHGETLLTKHSLGQPGTRNHEQNPILLTTSPTLPSLPDMKIPQVTTNIEFSEVAHLVGQNVRSMEEDSAQHAMQPVTGMILSPFIKSTEGFDLDEEQRYTASKISDIEEGIQDKMQVDTASEILPVRQIIQAADDLPTSDGVKLQSEPIVIDLTNDGIIDLTQDSDENITAEESMDDDSVIEMGAAVVSSEQNLGVSSQIRPARIMEPERQRERKEKRQRKREAKKLRIARVASILGAQGTATSGKKKVGRKEETREQVDRES